MGSKCRLVGVVLAGGRSTRMGRNKALLPYGEGRWVDHMAGLLRQVVPFVVVSGWVEGHPSVQDIKPALGPIGGIASVVARFSDKRVFLFVPVDMPFLSSDLLHQLIETKRLSSRDGVAFQGHELPLLLSISSKVRQVLALLCQEEMPEKKRSIRMLHQKLDIQMIAPPSYGHRCFLNVNTPEELEELSL